MEFTELYLKAVEGDEAGGRQPCHIAGVPQYITQSVGPGIEIALHPHSTSPATSTVSSRQMRHSVLQVSDFEASSLNPKLAASIHPSPGNSRLLPLAPTSSEAPYSKGQGFHTIIFKVR